MTLIFLPLLVVGAIVAWAAGARTRTILLGVLAAAVLMLVSSILLVGAVAVFDDGGDGGDEDVTYQVGDIRDVDAQFEVAVEDGAFAAPRRPIDGLTDGETRLIEITGLPANWPVLVRQCRANDRVCDTAIPARVDPDGSVTFLFEFAACDSCTLVVTDDEAGHLVSIPIAFGVALPNAVLRLDRSSGLRPGDELTVALNGFTAGSYTVSYCTPPGPVDPTRCGAPAPEVRVQVGPDGAATATLPVYEGAVGIERAPCGRAQACAVAVLGRSDAVVVPVSFAGSADADPGTAQVVIGLLVAAVLFGVAFVAMRRESWTPPDGDPFAGIVLVDPFADLDDEDDEDDEDQPATSRRENETAPTATITRT